MVNGIEKSSCNYNSTTEEVQLEERNDPTFSKINIESYAIKIILTVKKTKENKQKSRNT
jgi:hypothetical protein